MPSSAVASGLVDLVLPAEEIGTKLQQYVRSLHALDAIADDADERRSAERRDGALQEIHADLRKRIGHDFRSYKEKTFLRRVHRRMQVARSARSRITSSCCERTPMRRGCCFAIC